MLKQIWDMSMYISFVFHQKSANQVVKPVNEREEEDVESGEDDSEYSGSQKSSVCED